MAIEHLLTVADYHDYVEHLPPDARAPELLNGRFAMAARPSRLHMRYAQGLFRMIDTYVREHHWQGEVLTEFEVVLDDHSIVIPDLAYLVEQSTLGRMTEERLYGAADMVCEIASPSTRLYDAQDKYLAYLRAGVREYWIIDPYRNPGEHFMLFERITTGTASGMPTFQRIEGGPENSRIFPGIVCDPKLL